MPVEVFCKSCNKPFKLSPNAVLPNGNFCSRYCYSVFQRTLTGEKANQWKGGERITLSCEECEKDFEIYPSQLKNKTTGVTRRFCSKSCWHKARERGVDNPNWRGGRSICSTRGYVLVWAPGHPKAVHNRVYEHRLVMEKHLGRYLDSDEHVHHIDGNTSNNTLSNLQLMSKSEHMLLHREQERQRRLKR